MAGGGSKGAYEAGVVWGLMHYGNPEDYRYDVVTGVSAGAINGAAMSVWPIGQEVAMSEYISDTW
jgi:predicted acylesterase/phospholipase RssA